MKYWCVPAPVLPYALPDFDSKSGHRTAMRYSTYELDSSISLFKLLFSESGVDLIISELNKFDVSKSGAESIDITESQLFAWVEMRIRMAAAN